MSSKSNPWSTEADTQTRSSDMLFNRTMTVLVGMNVISYGGTLLTASWQPTTIGLIAMFGIAIILIFVANFWARAADRDDPSPLVAVALFALVEGMSIGPALTMYKHLLGPQMVSYAFAIVIAATGVFGTIGSMVKFAYAKVENFLLIGLLGLIAFYFGSIVFTPPDGVNLWMAIGGSVLFCGFLVVDFARLAAEGTTQGGWGVAGVLAMNIYLDMLNLLLQILRIMATKKKD